MLALAQTVTLVAATLTAGLTAGLFYAFSCAVMPGLVRVDDRTFVTAMRAINVAILNRWFALGFGGALLLTPVTAALHLAGDGRAAVPWLVAAVALHLAMLLVTGRVNVPLNDRLADATGNTDPDRAAARGRFERPWSRWNLVRTVVSAAALASLLVAVLVR